MENGNLILQLCTIIGLLLPIATLIWKAAKQSGKIEHLENELENAKQTIKTIQHKQDTDIARIERSLNQLNISYAEIRTSLSFIQEQLKK